MENAHENAKENAIEFCQVDYLRGDRPLVQQLTFPVKSGETLILLGQSGCGKTTTLKLINGLLLPTSGQVLVSGKPTQQWDLIQLRRQIGYVIQEIGLFPHFTVAQNIGLVPSLLEWPAGKTQQRVYELLETVDLNPAQFAQRYPHQLSGGQRQRVGVARALAADPPILLLDEPFGALDPITRLELQRTFLNLQQHLQKTVVFVTHDIQEALLLGTQIGFFQSGKLLSLTSPQGFYHSARPEAQAFLQGFRMVDDLRKRLQGDPPHDSPLQEAFPQDLAS
ncbi:MAG: ATP-binding cassette domain-containing protein [Thermosynechococcaceae cyanobacterium MS004]|nr:ATP-binding cassette domain-containing protein [Thermosynechococcaceae cyanobacterium MS004]